MSQPLPVVPYSEKVETQINKIIASNSDFYQERSKLNMFTWNNIVMMAQGLANDFSGSFMSPIFKTYQTPPSTHPPYVEKGDNILILSSHPYYNMENSSKEIRFDPSRPCIFATEEQKDKVKSLFPNSDYNQKVWFWAYFPLPVDNRKNRLEKEYYFFSYYFYLVLLDKLPTHVFVTNNDVYDKLSLIENWFKDCKISLRKENVGKRSYSVIKLSLENGIFHEIKFAKLNHPTILCKNIDTYSYNKNTVRLIIEGENEEKGFKETTKEEKVKVYKNIFEKIKDSQIEKTKEEKEKKFLQSKQGTEQWKKKKVKDEAKEKRNKDKRKKEEKMRKEHSNVLQTLLVKKSKVEAEVK
jgi:hypothetical protein